MVSYKFTSNCHFDSKVLKVARIAVIWWFKVGRCTVYSIKWVVIPGCA